jgi:hypothetical protein
MIAVDEAENWLRQLPFIECKIKQSISAAKQGESSVVTYEVSTYIEDEKKVKIHKYADFLYLEELIKRKCNPEKAPWIDRDPPILFKPEMKDFPDYVSFVNGRIQSMEKFLSIIVADPRYLISPTLEFLGIPDPYKNNFISYNRYLKNTSRKEQLGGSMRRDAKETELMKLDLLKSPNKLMKRYDELPFFTCFCKSAEMAPYENHYQYTFVISDQNDPTHLAWSIVKIYKDFKDFNSNLEKAIGSPIAAFDQLVPKADSNGQTTDMEFIKARQVGLEKYLNFILKNRRNYKDLLYEFLEYHIATREDSSTNVTPRGSFYGESPSPAKKDRPQD